MFRSGDSIENPVTGERVVFIRTAVETDGELCELETVVQPGGFVATAHVHPEQEERFRVLDGMLRFRAGGEEFEVGPGGTITVPPGTPHRFWNAADREARFTCEVRPALHFEQLLETMFALAADGKTNHKGLPNVLRLAVIAHAYDDTIRLPWPPASLQRAGLALVAPIGRMLGYAAAYPQQRPARRRPRRIDRPRGASQQPV
jgi:mannose-6-phosphate isomerase-like protein (cupin superfamily)